MYQDYIGSNIRLYRQNELVEECTILSVEDDQLHSSIKFYCTKGITIYQVFSIGQLTTKVYKNNKRIVLSFIDWEYDGYMISYDKKENEEDI